MPAEGMRAAVTCLRLAGVKQRGETVEGYIASESATSQASMAYQYKTRLGLYRSADRQHGTYLKPLFDAQFLQWDSRGIFVQGWEIDVNAAGQQVQHIQIWCVAPLP